MQKTKERTNIPRNMGLLFSVVIIVLSLSHLIDMNLQEITGYIVGFSTMFSAIIIYKIFEVFNF